MRAPANHETSPKPSSDDCPNGLAQLLSSMVEDKVAEQVAAPTETRTPNLHRATIAHQECGWKGGDSGNSVENTLPKNRDGVKILLDYDRPSHGRPFRNPSRWRSAGITYASVIFRQSTLCRQSGELLRSGSNQECRARIFREVGHRYRGLAIRQSMWLQRSTNFHHLNPKRFSGSFWIVVTTPKPPARRNMTGMYSPAVSLCIGSPGFFCRAQASI